MKQFHRILLEKELLFLKKTTNFCTATIFDTHFVKKEKQSGKAYQFIWWLPTVPDKEGRPHSDREAPAGSELGRCSQTEARMARVAEERLHTVLRH